MTERLAFRLEKFRCGRVILLCVVLFLAGTSSAHAVDSGDGVHKDGISTSKGIDDPVLRFMRNQGWIPHAPENTRLEGSGTPRLETADAILINNRKEYDWNRYLKAAMHLPDWIDLGLENRTRFESYDHPWRTSQNVGNGGTDAQLALRSRVRVGLGGHGPLRLLFEGQDSRAFFDGDPGAFHGTTNVDEFDILQLLGSLTVRNLFGSGLRTDAHFGRMTLDFGRRRLISRNNFRNTVNSFDGLHWQIARDATWRFRAFFVEPVVRDEVSLDRQNSKLLFWGAYWESRHVRWLQIDTYYMGLQDQRLNAGTLRRTYATFGGRLSKDPQPGEFDYEIESTWQTGTLGATDHFAYFQHLDLGYTIQLPWTPRILFHYAYASGDRNPNDGHNESFDSLFGDRSWEYNPTGIFGPFFRTNFSSPGWRVILTPAKGLSFQVKHRVWYLAQSKDAFGSSGLRDETGQAGRSIGQDVEVRLQWALNKNLDFDVGYTHWFKGSYFDRLPALAGLPAGGNKDTDYFFAAMRVRM